MKLTDSVDTTAHESTQLTRESLPDMPDRQMNASELQVWVDEFAKHKDLWASEVAHDTGDRHFASLYRDNNIDVWLLCWNVCDDTGWHDHDVSSGAVAVTRGEVSESRLRIGEDASTRVVDAGRSFGFGPDHIHRMSGHIDGSVSIHVYSPPLWRMGQYSVSPAGVLRRLSVSYADELRPMDESEIIERSKSHNVDGDISS